MKIYIIMSLICLCGCSNANRYGIVQEGNAFYEYSAGCKKFAYAIDNKGNYWNKDTLLVAGVGPLKNMVIPVELKDIQNNLQKEIEIKESK